ncbi:hypothetical protein [uncultured Legionella sp.]|uniref:hypothetical protein n=1 Tax=uncultured Legionella sp. TaxID=210934 RepID=UPI002608D386|nr:hypothetical protein [uncultured Legionella sp.]
MYTFENTGVILQRTNYFDSAAAKEGEFYLTWNAGCARLLVPDNQKHLLSEMRQSKFVSISLIPGGLEILFDDETDEPFMIQIAQEQTDRVISIDELGKTFQFSVYIRLGEKYAFPGIIQPGSK